MRNDLFDFARTAEVNKVRTLHFHHLEDGPNIAKGSSSLRILGEKMSSVDFLVREAIQNSSDACFRARNDGKTFVCIDFDTGTFQPRKFNALFNEEVRRVLDRRYSSKACNWIAISDFNCEGLNGDVHPSDPKYRSNFCRLICDSGEAQDKEGSGGCWGYGKSVYYRIGIGIVLFYSRYLNDAGKFKSRLIIKLAEDEKSSDALLREAGYTKSAGIAWWCKEERDGWVFPIEDDRTISEVLSIFGVKRYEDDPEGDHGHAQLTGTKIIVPYFDPDEVCKGLQPKLTDENNLSADQNKQVQALVSDIHTALKYATLRWYSSRLGNTWLKQYNRQETNAKARIPLLKVRVQGEPVNVEDSSAPDFFKAVQDLYNCALYEAACSYWPYNKSLIHKPQSIVLKSIAAVSCNIRNYLAKTRAGWVVHSVFKSANPSMANPYILTNKYSLIEGENMPMLFFMREPGMVIDYSIGDEWLKNVGSTGKTDEYVLALFYPDVKARLKEEIGSSFPKFNEQNLGYYLRSCEEAEHSTWTEPSGLRIVERIRVNCASRLASVYSKTVEPTGGTAGLLANYLSNRLMRPPKKKTTGETTSSRHSTIKITGVDTIRPGEVRLKYEMNLVKTDCRIKLDLLLLLDSGHVSFEKWTKTDSPYDGPFPLKMTEFIVEAINANGDETEVNQDIINEKIEVSDMRMLADANQASFEKKEFASVLKGNILIHVDNPMYKFKLSVKSEVPDGE